VAGRVMRRNMVKVYGGTVRRQVQRPVQEETDTDLVVVGLWTTRSVTHDENGNHGTRDAQRRMSTGFK
jgi:hypothetical protein